MYSKINTRTSKMRLFEFDKLNLHLDEREFYMSHIDWRVNKPIIKTPRLVKIKFNTVNGIKRLYVLEKNKEGEFNIPVFDSFVFNGHTWSIRRNPCNIEFFDTYEESVNYYNSLIENKMKEIKENSRKYIKLLTRKLIKL